MTDRNYNFYRVQGEEMSEGFASKFPEPRGGYGGYRGRVRGVFGGKGRGQITFYNCGQLGNLAMDFQLPPRVYCNYYKDEDHAIEECPQLIAKWK